MGERDETSLESDISTIRLCFVASRSVLLCFVRNTSKLVETQTMVRDKFQSLRSRNISNRGKGAAVAKAAQKKVTVEPKPETNESRAHDYMDTQPETLHLIINIVDRFLSVKTVPRRELQLVGINAMLMASKYEEIWDPEVNDFVCISDRAYTHEHIDHGENYTGQAIEWTLTVAMPYVFLVRFIKASIPVHEMQNMVSFLAELGMMHYATIMYCPSMVAASASLCRPMHPKQEPSVERYT
ncbi:hypothetical protein L1049_007674 [Liquidambar formosana]|uniref:Cyclin-like domain-containing protein n=1 Tax=Liquidambar formosana TaxID=63359 RepID=A0AAP0S9C1_LIQFO